MGQGFARLEDEYFLQKVKLGQGSFGTVWRAVDRKSKDVVAIKQLDKASMARRGVSRSDIMGEMKVVKALSHENVIRVFRTFEDQHSIFIALEYCDGSDFGDKLREIGLGLEEYEAAEWMRQIVAAICALHSNDVCHRDIKPDNFMVHQDTLKLSDFGLATFLPPNVMLTQKCGTPAFMCPEQHSLPRLSKGYNNLCDVWAAGITMYMVLCGGRHPFVQEDMRLDGKKLLGAAMDFSVGKKFLGFGGGQRFSASARRLCRRMVEPDAGRRCAIDAVARDAWLTSGFESLSSTRSSPRSSWNDGFGSFFAPGAPYRKAVL